MRTRGASVTGSLAVVLLSIVPLSATAALSDQCGCNAGLAPEVTKYGAESWLSLAFLRQIDEKQFDNIRKRRDATLTFLGLDFSGEYDEFESSRREHLSKYDFDLDVEQSESLLFTTIRTADWSDCKRQCIRSENGFACDVAEVTQRHVAVSCSWRPDVSVPTDVKVIANGRELPGTTTRISPSNTKDWHVERNPAADLLLTFKPDPGSDQTLKIATVPEPTPETVPQDIVIDAVEYLQSASFGILPTTWPGNPNWEWGEGIANGGPPWDASRKNKAVYAIHAPKEGAYEMAVEYASGDLRPVDIYVNGALDKQGVLAKTTGGFCLNPTRTGYCKVSDAKWSDELGDRWTVDLREGTNEIVIERGAPFPHIKTIRLSYVEQ
jgi:hypothetical protein